MALRTVGVRLAAEVSGYINNLRTAKRATTDFVGELNRAAKAGNLDAVADQARNMGLALSAGFGAVVAVGARFDKQMSAVQAATHATAGEMERLRQAALQAGADTSFSATEAAQGIEELAKAGISTSDVLRGGLKGALDLAAAGGIDVAEAAETAASAMTQFGLSGSQVPHVADLLAAAAGKAQGGVRDLSYALSQSGLVASQVGLTIEETTGALAAFASAGLLGSDAGTSFKTMLQRLVAPSGEAARKMQELGIRAFDAQGRFIGLEKFAGNLQTALSGLTDEQRNAALATIFGSDAIRAASVIYQQGEQGIRDWIKAVNDQGFAAETAAARTDNLMGDIERLTGSLETLAIESSTGASAGLRTIVQAADNVVASISQIPAPVQSAAVGIAGVTGAALLAASAAIRMRESMAKAAEQLTALGPLGERTARGLNRITVAAGRVGVALTVAQVASAAFGEGLDPRVRSLASSLEEFAASGKVSGEMARLLGDDLHHLDDALRSVADTGVWSDIGRGIAGTIEGLTGLGSVMDDSLQKNVERLRALDQALTSLVAEGKADQAAEVFEQIRDRASEYGISVAELNRVLPDYTAAVEEANKAGDIAARVQAEAKVKADLLADGWEDAAKAADGLRAAHEKLAGELLESIDAEIAWREAMAEARDEIGKIVKGLGAHEDAVTNDRTALDLNTKAGREVARMLRDLTDETIEATQAKFDETKSVEEARKVYEEGRKALVDSMVQAGLTRQAAEKLADAWLKMPKVVGPEVRAPGLDPTLNKARELVRVLNNVPDNVKISVRGPERVAFAKGGIYEPATGMVAAQHGLITDRPMVLFGERGTGAEAFIPRDGISRQRGLGLLDVAARWHGAAVVPWEQMATKVSLAGMVVENHIEVGGEVVRVVRSEIRDHDRGLRQRVRAGAGRR